MNDITQSKKLNGVVFDAVDQSDGDRNKAIAAVLQSLADDNNLYNDVAEHLVTIAVKSLVGDQWIRNRKAAFTPPDQSADIKNHADMARHSLLDGWRLEYNGKLLGDASHADVLAEMDLYLDRVHKNQFKANLLKLIAGKMGKSRKVRNALDENTLRSLQKQAEV